MGKPTKISGLTSCVGVDEAGRGAWAGPVVAGAALFTRKPVRGKWRDFLLQMSDSKKMSEKKRENMYDRMQEFAIKGYLYLGIGIVDNTIVDRIGIRSANHQAMTEALNQLQDEVDISEQTIIIDGRDNYVFSGISNTVEYLVKGDTKILQIMCGALHAKVTRDRLMREYNLSIPGYYFDSHKGYGTKKHQEALVQLGVCEIHRRSYTPIRAICN